MKQNIASGQFVPQIPVPIATCLSAQKAGPCDDVENLPSKEEIDRWCIDTIRRADEMLKSSIILPRGHEWGFPSNRFTFGASPADAVEYGASIFISKRLPRVCLNNDHISDPDQVKLEIRIQLPTRQYRTKKGSVGRFCDSVNTGYRMFLCIKSGSQFAEQGMYHVQETFPAFPGAATLEDAVAEVARVANDILYEAIPSRMPARITEAQYEVKAGQLVAAIKRHDAGKKDSSLPLAAKVEHNRARNRAQEQLRELRLNRFALTGNQT